VKKPLSLAKANVALARQRWGPLPKSLLMQLSELSRKLHISVAAGDVLCLYGKWYVTHAGLLAVAQRKRCAGIHVELARECSDPSQSLWTVKAIVYKSSTCRGFVGYGDASPFNVSPQVLGAEMRVAETRAVNRALRKAYGIGICSVEELGAFSGPLPPARDQKKPVRQAEPAGNNGHRRPLRDRLCLLIRQHQLDPSWVKAYAADYCDISELRQASRQQVATFIQHLGEALLHAVSAAHHFGATLHLVHVPERP